MCLLICKTNQNIKFCEVNSSSGSCVGLRRVPACWGCRLESRLGHGHMSVVNVVCCTGSSLCDGPILFHNLLNFSSNLSRQEEYPTLKGRKGIMFIGPCIILIDE